VTFRSDCFDDFAPITRTGSVIVGERLHQPVSAIVDEASRPESGIVWLAAGLYVIEYRTRP
jgi:hypothetical protein